MKILFADYIEQTGHVNFNRIHIDELKNEGHDVKIAVHSTIANRLPYNKEDYAIIFPKFLKQRKGHSLLNRLCFAIALLMIKCHLFFNHYDRIIISSVDELTLAIIPPSNKFIAICHTNANSLTKEGLKKKCMLSLGKKAKFLVFNDYMKMPFEKLGLDICTIAHGCIPPFKCVSECNIPEIKGVDHILFHPSSKHDEIFENTLINDIQFNTLLNKTNSIVLMNGIGKDKDRIKYINRRLSDKEYQSLFLKADIILIFYPDTFEYRVSGVSFECVSNKKPFLVNRCKSMDYCQQLCNYNPYVSSAAELTKKTENIIMNAEYARFVDNIKITPNYKNIL